MTAFLSAAAIAFAVVFVAEIGDKSQLMALTFATRFRALPVIIGITVAAALTHGLSVGVGYVLGASLPTFWVTLVAAVVFIAFGVWTLREDSLPGDDDADGADDDAAAGRRSGVAGGVSRSAILAVGTAFFLAELGDKTMIASVTLASQHPTVAGILGVWVGATVGMVLVGVVAVAIGRALGRRLPERTIRIGSALLFFAFGIWLGVEAFLMA